VSDVVYGACHKCGRNAVTCRATGCQADGEFPRRMRVDKFCAAELKIREAMLAIEAMPGDVRLTAAQDLLIAAQAKVADFVDGLP
jgi:hypothetical protein